PSRFIASVFTGASTPWIYTLSLHDALPIWPAGRTTSDFPGSRGRRRRCAAPPVVPSASGWHRVRKDRAATRPARRAEQRTVVFRSEEHTSELHSRGQLVCRLLLETKHF